MTARRRERSQQPRKLTAVEQDVLAGNEACLHAAEKRTHGAELCRIAEASRRNLTACTITELLDIDILGCRELRMIGLEPVGVELSGEHVVDRHIMARHVAGESADKSREARSR